MWMSEQGADTIDDPWNQVVQVTETAESLRKDLQVFNLEQPSQKVNTASQRTGGDERGRRGDWENGLRESSEVDSRILVW